MIRELIILMSLTLPTPWLHATHDAYNRYQVGAATDYLTSDQAARRERLRQARLLFEGRHRQYFLLERRTAFDFPLVTDAFGRQRELYLSYNLLGLISLKSADLLFGESPLVRVDDDLQQAAVDDIADRSLLPARLHAAAQQASWAGGAFFEVCRFRGEVYVCNAPPDELYPLGPMRPDGQFDRYVRYATANAGTEQQPITLLLETRYEPGLIRRRCWQLDQTGRRSREVDLDAWQLAAGREGEPMAPEEATGIDDNSIVYVPNELGDDARAEARSDYDGDLIELQDTVNSKQTQIARVLAKHADPRLALPETAAEERGDVDARADVFFFRTKDDIPSYIVWNAEVQSAMEDRRHAVQAFCVSAEMSPVLLGIKEGAAPDAARKLRLEATNSLAKAQRKAAVFAPAVRRLMALAQAMEAATPLTRRTLASLPIGVEMRDGLPVDELDDANVVATYRAAGVMSRYDGVSRRKSDPAAIEEELSRLDEESAAATPSVFMDRPATATTATAATTANAGNVPEDEEVVA